MKTTEELGAEIGAAIEDRPVQMPMPWAPSERAIPNEFIAASVFSALQMGEATFANKPTLIGEWNGYILHYEGRRLTQVHADVWFAVIEIARWLTPGSKVVFTARQLLRIMGRDTSTTYREKLHKWIKDMQTCLVEITMPGGREGYSASLFPEAVRRKRADGTAEYSLVLHRVLWEAFARGYSIISHAQRKALGRNELALWLQQYITAFPMAVSLERLQSLSGAPATQRLADFRRKLLVSLRALKTAGVVTGWTITTPVEQLVAELPRRLKAGA